MAQTLIQLANPNSAIIVSTTDAAFNLFTANFTTEVVASSLLSASAIAYLQQNLRKVLAAVPSKAAVENGFAGLVRGLVVCQCFEASGFYVAVAYSAPTATYSINGLPSLAHVAVSIPFSASAPVIGNP